MPETAPYLPAEPGQLISAERDNDLQVAIRDDIAARVAAAKDEIVGGRVERAGDAERFASRTPGEWTDALDERYAPKHHDHEGRVGYRRYVKHFDDEVTKRFLVHELGRFPIVDVYRLDPVVGPDARDHEFDRCKVLFFGGHNDADRYDLRVRAYGERALRGIRFERWLEELGVEYEDDDTISDVVSDMWNAFMKDPNDEIPDGHCQTSWVEKCCQRNRTVAELRQSDEWDDLYIALKPVRFGLGDASPGIVRVEQVNYDTIYLETVNMPVEERRLDVMVLLRI
jgi:hypothetical protein